MTKLINLIRDEEGATALEYGLIAALIAAAIGTAVGLLGDEVSKVFTYITGKMQEATADLGA